uniref:Uncharacterized protein n=1 Tax=Chromera velia CCMP2878 TaxID=1169474 RepID=A0A0G4F359_9ALVE|eukprot:Cvel_14879.t1-p1 / transcript=Cvel_14879.t1 / gene=Cvel_14879 / organism=Chromera_velia_CCMP2878 / gene_product=hypothetical protein / transcript_product=hypothetical protein / location=Cvel_scaffold1076:30170-33246(-) / protein_length=721 / sequence_SO=supercontig / SO=protein_coding / is_pseudo=false
MNAQRLPTLLATPTVAGSVTSSRLSSRSYLDFLRASALCLIVFGNVASILLRFNASSSNEETASNGQTTTTKFGVLFDREQTLRVAAAAAFAAQVGFPFLFYVSGASFLLSPEKKNTNFGRVLVEGFFDLLLPCAVGYLGFVFPSLMLQRGLYECTPGSNTNIEEAAAEVPRLLLCGGPEWLWVFPVLFVAAVVTFPVGKLLLLCKSPAGWEGKTREGVLWTLLSLVGIFSLWACTFVEHFLFRSEGDLASSLVFLLLLSPALILVGVVIGLSLSGGLERGPLAIWVAPLVQAVAVGAVTGAASFLNWRKLGVSDLVLFFWVFYLIGFVNSVCEAEWTVWMNSVQAAKAAGLLVVAAPVLLAASRSPEVPLTPGVSMMSSFVGATEEGRERQATLDGLCAWIVIGVWWAAGKSLVDSCRPLKDSKSLESVRTRQILSGALWAAFVMCGPVTSLVSVYVLFPLRMGGGGVETTPWPLFLVIGTLMGALLLAGATLTVIAERVPVVGHIWGCYGQHIRARLGIESAAKEAEKKNGGEGRRNERGSHDGHLSVRSSAASPVPSPGRVGGGEVHTPSPSQTPKSPDVESGLRGTQAHSRSPQRNRKNANEKRESENRDSFGDRSGRISDGFRQDVTVRPLLLEVPGPLSDHTQQSSPLSKKDKKQKHHQKTLLESKERGMTLPQEDEDLGEPEVSVNRVRAQGEKGWEDTGSFTEGDVTQVSEEL